MANDTWRSSGVFLLHPPGQVLSQDLHEAAQFRNCSYVLIYQQVLLV